VRKDTIVRSCYIIAKARLGENNYSVRSEQSKNLALTFI